VELCSTPEEFEDVFVRLQRKAWFREHGALAPQLVQPWGWDLRLAVAGGQVVGAARADLVRVDLLPTGRGFVVFELNGAVDFRPLYAPGRDVFADAVEAVR
jgi:hypothetical protein